MSTPEDIAHRIRAHGAVLDMEFTQAIYRPLLERQPREGVSVTRDLAYGPDVRHRLDVYRPASAPGGTGNAPTAPTPALIFLHGGGFIRGDKGQRDNVGYYFASHGYVTVLANYRLAPAHHWPAGAQDAVAVTQWLRTHAHELGVDSSRIVLGGESAGAAHVAAAVLIRRFQPTAGLGVAAALLISGVYNVHLEKLARRQFGVATPDPRNEAYFGSEFEGYPAMSTIELIDTAPLPLFISYAELDPLQMQVQAGELFARLVCRHGFEPELHVVRAHNHLTQVYAINTGDESLSQPLWQFLQRHASP